MDSLCRVFRGGGCAAVLFLMLSTPSPAQDHARPLEPADFLPQADFDMKTSSAVPTSCEVLYHGGQLMIHAKNSTLADVLKTVAERTGAIIDAPPESELERIFERAGPGPADEVLSSLLNGSNFDFVIVSSPEAPHMPTRVLLFARGLAPTSTAQQEVRSASSSPVPELYGAGFSANPDDDDSSPEVPTPLATTEPPGAQGDVLPGTVLDQMQKERIRQRQLQQQQAHP